MVDLVRRNDKLEAKLDSLGRLTTRLTQLNETLLEKLERLALEQLEHNSKLDIFFNDLIRINADEYNHTEEYVAIARTEEYDLTENDLATPDTPTPVTSTVATLTSSTISTDGPIIVDASTLRTQVMQ